MGIATDSSLVPDYTVREMIVFDWRVAAPGYQLYARWSMGVVVWATVRDIFDCIFDTSQRLSEYTYTHFCSAKQFRILGLFLCDDYLIIYDALCIMSIYRYVDVTRGGGVLLIIGYAGKNKKVAAGDSAPLIGCCCLHT
jgi:hypothetical protein